jgi:hypothetical protein
MQVWWLVVRHVTSVVLWGRCAANQQEASDDARSPDEDLEADEQHEIKTKAVAQERSEWLRDPERVQRWTQVSSGLTVDLWSGLITIAGESFAPLPTRLAEHRVVQAAFHGAPSKLFSTALRLSPSQFQVGAGQRRYALHVIGTGTQPGLQEDEFLLSCTLIALNQESHAEMFSNLGDLADLCKSQVGQMLSFFYWCEPTAPLQIHWSMFCASPEALFGLAAGSALLSELFSPRLVLSSQTHVFGQGARGKVQSLLRQVFLMPTPDIPKLTFAGQLLFPHRDYSNRDFSVMVILRLTVQKAALLSFQEAVGRYCDGLGALKQVVMAHAVLLDPDVARSTGP